MKKLIQKWLGIDELEKRIPRYPTQDALRLLIGEAFEAALSGKEDHPWCDVLSMYHIPNKLETALEVASRKTAGEIATARVEHRIGGEAFVDELVTRIQRKQLR